MSAEAAAERRAAQATVVFVVAAAGLLWLLASDAAAWRFDTWSQASGLVLAAGLTAWHVGESLAVRAAAERYESERGWWLMGPAASLAVVLLPPGWALVTAAACSGLFVAAGRYGVIRTIGSTAIQVVAAAPAVWLVGAVYGGSDPLQGASTTPQVLATLTAAAIFQFGTSLLVAAAVSWTMRGWSRELVHATLRAAGSVGVVNSVLTALSATVWAVSPWLAGVLLLAPLALNWLLLSQVHVGFGELKTTTAERDRLARTIAGASDGIALVDRHGQVALASPQLARLAGVGPDEMVGRQLDDLLHLRDTSVAALCGRLTDDDHIAEVRTELGGAQLPVRVNVRGGFAPDGQLRDAVVVVRDESVQRGLDELKDELIARVSHELRTPLAPIVLHAGVLQRSFERMSPDRVRESLGVILDRSHYLSRLIEDLLAVSPTPASNGPQVTATRVADVVEQARADTLAAYPGRQLQVTVTDPSLQVAADAVRLRQVLTNLVTNACKFSPDPEPVHVSARSEGTEHVVVAVRDRGPGVAPADRDRIFERFQRGSDPDHRGGYGVGLYLVKTLTESMGGSVTLEQPDGGGSIFTVTLPSAAPPVDRALEKHR